MANPNSGCLNDAKNSAINQCVLPNAVARNMPQGCLPRPTAQSTHPRAILYPATNAAHESSPAESRAESPPWAAARAWLGRQGKQACFHQCFLAVAPPAARFPRRNAATPHSHRLSLAQSPTANAPSPPIHAARFWRGCTNLAKSVQVLLKS